MRQTFWTLRLACCSGLIGILVLFSAFALLSEHYYTEVRTARIAVRHHQQVVDALYVLLNHLIDLETGQRGYLLTGREDYLAPYSHAKSLVFDEVKQVRSLVASDPDQVQMVGRLDGLIHRKVDEMSHTISLSTHESSSAALDLVQTDVGRHAMDEIRAVIGGLLTRQRVLLDRHIRQSMDIERRISAIAAAGTLLAATLLVLGIYAGSRDLARRRAMANQTVAALKNAEKQVQIEQTSHQQTQLERDSARKADVAKSKFIATAAHDLRQPLQIIEMTMMSLPRLSGSEQAAAVQRGRRATRMLERVLTQFIQARQLAAERWDPCPELIPLHEVLTEMHDVYAPLAAQKKLALRLRATEAYVWCDRAMLERILSNLTLNALKYTQHGGVLLAARNRGDTVVIQVWDTGVGISEHHLKTIFEEFGRASAGTQGFGLGLFLCAQLARTLQTSLQVRTQPGRGSCFYLSLPTTERVIPARSTQPLIA